MTPWLLSEAIRLRDPEAVDDAEMEAMAEDARRVWGATAATEE